MIHRFSFSNFYSFRDEQTVDFTVNKNAPDTEAYVESAFGVRVGKVLVAFGHNASGKTNVLKALSFLRWLFVDSFHTVREDATDLRVASFEFGEARAQPAIVQVEFEVGHRLFRYQTRLTDCEILSERLDVMEPSWKTFRYLFRRQYIPEESAYTVAVNRDLPDFRGAKDLAASGKRRDTSLVTIGAQASVALCEEVRSFWSDVRTDVDEVGRVRTRTDGDLDDACRFYKERPEALRKARDLLVECDLGLADVDVTEMPKWFSADHPAFYMLEGVHRTSGQSFKLPFHYESDGTQSLFVLLTRLLPVLESGGVAVLDELDADLHPLMVPRLLDLFVSQEHNPKNAQLIAGCHSVPVMNDLDKYQVLLVEKDAELRSEVWRLDDMGVRNDENFFAKYMAGAYGGVPQS